MTLQIPKSHLPDLKALEPLRIDGRLVKVLRVLSMGEFWSVVVA